MHLSNLIPFGLHVISNRLVDITEVERGVACGCICPSCKQRLVARFCRDKSDHFAHDKNASEQGINTKECSYSFFVAMRLMIKQCISDVDDLADFVIPPLEFVLARQDCSGKKHEQTFTVTEPKAVDIRDVKVETILNSSEIDIKGQVGEYTVALHFYYPGRSRFVGELNNDVCLIEIDLTFLKDMYINLDIAENNSFKNKVMEFVLNSISSKSWYSHPLMKSALQDASSSMTSRIEAKNKEIQASRTSRLERYSKYEGLGDYHCPRCEVGWFKEHKGLSCSQCYLPGYPIPRQ